MQSTIVIIKKFSIFFNDLVYIALIIEKKLYNLFSIVLTNKYFLIKLSYIKFN